MLAEGRLDTASGELAAVRAALGAVEEQTSAQDLLLNRRQESLRQLVSC